MQGIGEKKLGGRRVSEVAFQPSLSKAVTWLTSFCWGQCAACLCLSSRKAEVEEMHQLYILTEQCLLQELWCSASSAQRWEGGGLPGLQNKIFTSNPSLANTNLVFIEHFQGMMADLYL